MIRTLTACAVTALLVVVPARAQQTAVGNPAGTTSGSPQKAPGMPAMNQPNDADRIFVHAIAIGGRAEIMFAQLAGQRTHVAAIRQFAQRMVQDHTKASNQLMELARSAGLPIPEGLDQDYRTEHAAIDNLNGAAFDDAYIRGQITDHQQAVQLLEFEIGSGQDPALKQFAVETLPIVMHHLNMAQVVAAETMGVATRDMPNERVRHRESAPSAGNGGAAPAR
jgi:putative membrane protein